MAEESKWEGKASVELTSLTGDQIWPFWEDFGNLHKWFPAIDTCYILEGNPGQPGLTRYCAATTEEGTTRWAKERLLMIDPKEMCLSYEVIESSVGFKNYVANIKVLPCTNGCKVEWSFVCDPADGWRYEDLMSYIDVSLKSIVENMEKALQN